MAPAIESSARVYYWPGTGEGEHERPATFEEYLISIGLAPKTTMAYVSRAKLLEREATRAGFRLADATAFQIARLLAEISTMSNSYQGQTRSMMRHYWEWHDRRNPPLRAIRVPPQPAMVCQALEVDEAARLRDVALGRWPEGGAILLGLYLALRCEEIARAEWERFDDEMNFYTVFGKFSKTATLPVHPLVKEVFEPHRGTGYIFPGRKNVRAYVHPGTIWDWAKRLGWESGIPNFRTHQLRHTSLTIALENSSNLRSVMAFARHADPDVTAGYTRTTMAQLREVSDALKF